VHATTDISLLGSKHHEPYAASFGFDDTADADLLTGFSYGERWNGWAVPYLELDEALRAMKLFNPDPPSAEAVTLVYDELTKKFVFNYQDGDEPAVVEPEMLMMPDEDESRTVYNFGLALCWNETELDDSNEGNGTGPDAFQRAEVFSADHPRRHTNVHRGPVLGTGMASASGTSNSTPS
jgi:hypothetical protein